MKVRGALAGSAVIAVVSALAAAPALAADPTTVDVGRFPYAVAVDRGTHTAYVLNRGNGQAENGTGSLSTITSTGVQTKRVGGTPVAVAVDTTTHIAYVAVANTQSVLLAIGPNGTRRTPIDLPVDVAVDPTNGTVWVLEAPRTLVKLVGTTQTSYEIPGVFPHQLDVDTFFHGAYVLSPDGVLTEVLDNDRLWVRRLGGGAQALAVDHADGTVYVAHSQVYAGRVLHSARVSEVAGSRVSTADLGFVNVNGVAVDETTHTAAVSEYIGNNTAYGQLALVDGTRVKQRTVGGTPGAVAFDAADGAVCVANHYSDSVSIVQGTAVQEVPTGTDPSAVATDDSAGICYVANFRDHTVTEVPMP